MDMTSLSRTFSIQDMSPLEPGNSGPIRACQTHMIQALTQSPRVRFLVHALQLAGCPLSAARHLAAETCPPGLAGGYDPLTHQVVVCANECTTPERVEAILAHELIHLYDHCVRDLDLMRNEHLACTEIRAANLIHCQSLDDYFTTRDRCVKQRAAGSISVIRGMSRARATPLVDRVFDQCSKDLEPFGRIPFHRECEALAYSDLRLLHRWRKMIK
ncbi:mitochondrial inner membrane protease ATP23 homolog [Tigriopus californicus]|uniref:mitochondrial inner membrane protease ATP23 homolog n=1 Tax=Tigriopus californicus TaxID=6832 RepID=UPI0027DA332F|nr:mitochondrial inner membrane protease ATP23 homolog [Tigriopus californicus]XP_059089671.1 mitochondrial inner membrane protease ATP23 homolog [Tigriopus californicus]